MKLTKRQKEIFINSIKKEVANLRIYISQNKASITQIKDAEIKNSKLRNPKLLNATNEKDIVKLKTRNTSILSEVKEMKGLIEELKKI